MSAFDLDPVRGQGSAVPSTRAASRQGARAGEGERVGEGESEPPGGAARPSLGAGDEIADDLSSLRDRARQTSRQLGGQPLSIANHHSHLILKLLGG